MGKYDIGIIGSGATSTYLLKWILQTDQACAITVYERHARPGSGMPYSPRSNSPTVLCNAFSKEIPDLTRSFASWLDERSDEELSRWQDPLDLDNANDFFPRVMIGDYLGEEFEKLVAAGRQAGIRIDVKTGHDVTDIDAENVKTKISYQSGENRETRLHDSVVLATGHVFPDSPDLDGVTLLSPWPLTRLPDDAPDRFGILGSSLSAIDIAISVAEARGRFDRQDGKIRWKPEGRGDELQIAMMSHLGLLPEPDFFYPYPYEPMKHLTEAAVSATIEEGPDGLLDRVFSLLVEELAAADPDYFEGADAAAKTVSGFSDHYYRKRLEAGGMTAFAQNLSDARASFKNEKTIAHRYTLLRGHEIIDLALRHLTETDWDRFTTELMPVFADSYAAVPHISSGKLIALSDAGVLRLLKTGYDAHYRSSASGDVTVETDAWTETFPAIYDARGQSPHAVSELGFPTLRAQLASSRQSVTAPYRLKLASGHEGLIYCLSMPQLLERHPFTQGLISVSEKAKCVAEHISSGLAGHR